MKTPEEIKMGLECCGNSGKCKGCPYYGGYELCMGTLAEDALAYVQQLEQRLVEVNKTSMRWISVGERLRRRIRRFCSSRMDGNRSLCILGVCTTRKQKHRG